MPDPSEPLPGKIRSGDRSALARAITLIESSRADHRERAQELLLELMPDAGRASHVGITGVPGVGKSTAIEALGMYLIEQGHRVAVLAVDPSSTRTGGSILGDKTRMARLATHPDAYIRLFQSEQALPLGENMLFYWEDGKLQAIQLPGPEARDLGKDVVTLLQGVGRETMPLATEIFAMTSTAFRASITSWPDFLIVNFIRDQMSAWILNDVGYVPFVSGVKGMIEEVRQKGYARDYNAAMGVMGGREASIERRS